MPEQKKRINYYPFGLKHKGYNNQVNGRNHKYGFGGKEEQDEIGLDWMDFGARNYEPSLGRWMNLDPLADNYLNYSPYNYTMNNPILYIDPDGMAVWKPNGDGTWTAEAGDSAATLADDAGISFERAKKILASTPKDNPQGNMGTYKDGDVEKSAVDEGDVVAIPEQVESFQAEQNAIAENKAEIKNLENEVTSNETIIEKVDNDVDSITQKRDRTQQEYDLVIKAKLGKADFSDPAAGIGLGTAIMQARRQKEIKKETKKIKKLNRKSDSLKDVNKTKSAEIGKRKKTN